jgi:hypothetical protein
MSDPICVGAVFRVPLGAFTALGKVLAVDGEVVSVALADQTWTCAPGPLDYGAAGTALAHVPLHRAGLAAVEWAGVTSVTADELAGDYARWAAAPRGAREVVTAPVEVLFRALLDLNH